MLMTIRNNFLNMNYQPALRQIFELFFGKIITISFCLVIASFQAYANNNSDTQASTIPVFDLTPLAAKSSALPKYKNLDQKIATISQSSNLVFHGQVVAVEYQSAETNNGTDYPLTYITFSITEVLQGNYRDSEIDLMMIGMGRTPRNTFVFRSDRPILAKDDELIVFLAKGIVNGPVYIHHFFVVDGDVYDNQSCELVRGENDEILRGAVFPQPKILERPLGIGSLRLILKHSDNTASGEKIEKNKKLLHSEASTFGALNVEGFKELLPKKRKLYQLKKAIKKTKSNTAINNQSLKSADINLSLFFSTQEGLVRRGK
jgi:hypothetical protein